VRWRVCQRSLFRIHPPGGGYHAAVVEGGDDLVADPDGLLVDGDAFGFDLAGGDPAGSGPHGEVVDGVVISGHDHYRSALLAGVEPGCPRSPRRAW